MFERVVLGKMLYFDLCLFESYVISCNFCYMIGMGGVDLQEILFGYCWQCGGCNVLMVYNVVFDVVQFWDGWVKDFEQQVGGLLVNLVEMDIIEVYVVEQLCVILGYVQVFVKVFFGCGEVIIFDNICCVIVLFEVMLIMFNVLFDCYFKGNVVVLDVNQIEGFVLFVGKGCVVCYGGINVGGGMYVLFGVVECFGVEILLLDDCGWFVVIKMVSDVYVFCVFLLCNVVLMLLYFYFGKVWDLCQVVVVMGSSQFGVQLSDVEIDCIIDFFGSFIGDQLQVMLLVLFVSVIIMLWFKF